MRLIKQGDPYGCGLACVAMVAGRTYADVRETYREITRKKRADRIEPTQLPKLKLIMRAYDIMIEGRERRFGGRTPWELDLAYDALLKINLRSEGEEWHWVIWDHRRRRVLDPKVPIYKRPRFNSYWKIHRALDEADETD